MSARLVGWMPHIGRLTAAVGASARLGANADNDVVVRVDGVSRSHALLVEQPDGYYIEDKGSSNGTWVNGERIKRARLRHLDVITLGRFAEMVFVARETEVPVKGAAVPAPAAAMTAQLEWLDGPFAGQTVNLPHGEIVIGRAETCGLVVDSDAVSRMHARLTVSDDGVTIEDFGTVNGTAVNGQALSAALPLESGAEVDVGQVRRFRLVVNRGGAPSLPVAEEPDDFGSTRLVWSPKDLEMLEKARAAGKSGSRAAVKAAPAAPLPLSGSKKAAAPAASLPPAAPPVQAARPPAATPAAAAAPATPATPSAAVQGGGGSGAVPRTAIVGAEHTMLVPPTLGAPPSAVQPPASAAEEDDKTRYDPAAVVRMPRQFQEDAATSLGQGGPDELPTSLGERGQQGQRTAVTPMTSLDPPTALERAAAGTDDQTALPFGTSFAAGVRTEMGGSPFDLPTNEGAPGVLSSEDSPTSLSGAPDSDPATYMPSNAFDPRDRTNLPPDTVLGFRDVGPSARGTGSSGATYLSPRAPDQVPSAIQPPAPAPVQDSLSTIEWIKLTGDPGNVCDPARHRHGRPFGRCHDPHRQPRDVAHPRDSQRDRPRSDRRGPWQHQRHLGQRHRHQRPPHAGARRPRVLCRFRIPSGSEANGRPPMTCRPRYAVFVLLLGFAGGLAPPASAQAAAQATGSVSGTIANERNNRLRRISVTVRNRTTNDEEQDVTDNNGSFSFAGLTAGVYDVIINEPGFVAFRQEVSVTAGKNEPLTIRLQFTIQDFAPVTDRWRLQFPHWQRYPRDQDGEYPFVPNRGFDPYDQNVLKGDLPVIGNDIFLVLTGVSETPFEYRARADAVGRQHRAAGLGAVLRQGQAVRAPAERRSSSFEMFQGNTAFKPRDWAFRITPQFNLNYVNTKERNVVNATPEAGTTRRRDSTSRCRRRSAR